MLNTLYPPVVTVQPTAKLTPAILGKQRDGFFRYIKAVETRGTGVLRTLQMQGAGEGEDSGWPDVHRNLEKYLVLANSIISECQDLPPLSTFPSTAPTAPLPQIPQGTAVNSTTPRATKQYKSRKTDSGVGLESRPESRVSSNDESHGQYSRRPSVATIDATKTPMTPRRGFSALERIARGLMSLRDGKPVIEEVAKPPPKTPSKDKESRTIKTPKTLKKMRSLGALTELKHSNASNATISSRFGGKKSMLFDKETMRGERLAYEERTGINRTRLGYDPLG